MKTFIKKIFTLYVNHCRGITSSIWIELAAAFVNSGASVSVLFIALYLSNKLHMGTIEIGWIITSFGLGAMLGSLGGGLLCDKFSPKYLSIVTMALNGIALLIFPYFHNFYYLASLIACLGITNNAFSPANRTTIMKMATEKYQYKISGMRYMMINLGMGIYVFIDGRISTFGYKYLFIFNSIIILITTVLLLFSSFKYPALEKRTNYYNNSPIKYKNESNKRFFILLYIGFLFISLIYSQLRVTYPFYLHTYYQLNERSFSNLFVINTLLITILQVPLLSIAKSINSILISGIGALLIGIGMGLLMLGSSYNFAIFLCSVWTLGEILYFSTLQAVIYDNAHENHKGKHMGIYQLIMATAYMIGPIIGSMAYHYDQNLVWICCVLLGILTFFIHIRTCPR